MNIMDRSKPTTGPVTSYKSLNKDKCKKCFRQRKHFLNWYRVVWDLSESRGNDEGENYVFVSHKEVVTYAQFQQVIEYIRSMDMISVTQYTDAIEFLNTYYKTFLSQKCHGIRISVWFDEWPSNTNRNKFRILERDIHFPITTVQVIDLDSQPSTIFESSGLTFKTFVRSVSSKPTESEISEEHNRLTSVSIKHLSEYEYTNNNERVIAWLRNLPVADHANSLATQTERNSESTSGLESEDDSFKSTAYNSKDQMLSDEEKPSTETEIDDESLLEKPLTNSLNIPVNKNLRDVSAHYSKYLSYSTFQSFDEEIPSNVIDTRTNSFEESSGSSSTTSNLITEIDESETSKNELMASSLIKDSTLKMTKFYKWCSAPYNSPTDYLGSQFNSSFESASSAIIENNVSRATRHNSNAMPPNKIDINAEPFHGPPVKKYRTDIPGPSGINYLETENTRKRSAERGTIWYTSPTLRRKQSTVKCNVHSMINFSKLVAANREDDPNKNNDQSSSVKPKFTKMNLN